MKTAQKNVLEHILSCHHWNHIDRVCYRIHSSNPLSGEARERVEQAIESKTYTGPETVIIGGEFVDGKRIGGEMYNVYQTLIEDGKAKSCTCPSRKPCKHMTQLEAHEAERRQESEDFHAWLGEIDPDKNHQEWTREELAAQAPRDAGLVQAPNGVWMTPERLANVPGNIPMERASLGNNRHTLPAQVVAPTPAHVSQAWLLGRR